MGDCFWCLETLTLKLLILNKFFSLDQYCWHATFDEWKCRLCFLGSIKFEKQTILMFSGLPFYSWVIVRTIFSLKNLVRYLWTFKQQITLRMIFLKYNSLKSDIFFNPIFTPCFSGSMFFRVQVFQSPGFSGSRLFRVQVIQGPGFSGSSFFRVQVFQGSCSGSGSGF